MIVDSYDGTVHSSNNNTLTNVDSYLTQVLPQQEYWILSMVFLLITYTFAAHKLAMLNISFTFSKEAICNRNILLVLEI